MYPPIILAGRSRRIKSSRSFLLHSKFNSSVGSLRPFLKLKNKTRKRWNAEGKEGESKVRGEIVGQPPAAGDQWRHRRVELGNMGLVFALVTVMD